MRSRAIRSAALVLVLAAAHLTPLGAQSERQVKIRTLSVWDILYVLTGGSNSLGLMRDDGVVLIDSQPAGWGKPTLDAIEEVTDQPVTTVVNTHSHLDHVGGNVELPTATTIVAHPNTKARMAALEAFQGGNAKFLPNTLVSDQLTMFEGGDRMEIYYFGKAHTDGDLVVAFPEKRIAHFGDLFPAKALPVIDTASGGSAVAFPETLARAVATLKNIARVTTGHDTTAAASKASPGAAVAASPRPMTWAELEEYVEFNRDFVAAVRQAKAAGQSADQAAAGLRMPARYTGYDLSRAKENIAILYAELGQ